MSVSMRLGHVTKIECFGWLPVGGRITLTDGTEIPFNETQVKTVSDLTYFRALPEASKDMFTKSPMLKLNWPVAVYEGEKTTTVKILDNYCDRYNRTYLDQLALECFENGDASIIDTYNEFCMGVLCQ